MNRKEIVFATNNAAKVKEIRQMTGNGYKILTLSDIGCHQELPENQNTLEGNAREKARFLFEIHGKDCFADDTGLEVTALDGRPGVYSARYAGEPSDPEANIDKLLGELSGIENRSARFRTVICLILQGREYFFDGSAVGRILQERTGNQGFGYDPVFVPDGFTRSFAEMTMEEKNIISHRGRAVKKLTDFLNMLAE
jgi:XTP/dITP diphosphohydrolase